MLTQFDIIHNKKYLRECLLTENILTENEFEMLNEEQQEIVISELIKNVIDSIANKMKDIDTTIIDKSRGDIKYLSILSDIQNAIKELQYYISSASGKIGTTGKQYIHDITTAIMNLNKYSAVFKDAYRSKKTIMMVEYQSILMAIITSISYLISEAIDFTDLPKIKLKQNIQFNEINQLKCIKKFNMLCQTNQLHTLADSVSFLREYFVEYSVQELNIICEASDIGDMINNGFTSFVKSITNNPQLSQLLMKVANILMILMAVREIVYSIGSKGIFTKSIENIANFVNHNDLKPTQIAAVKSYNKKNIVDTVVSSNSATNVLSIENNNIVDTVNSLDNDINISTKNSNIYNFDLSAFNL